MTVAEIAAELRLSRMSVYRLVDAGAFEEVLRINARVIRIPRTSYEAYLQRNQSPAPRSTPVPHVPGQMGITL